MTSPQQLPGAWCTNWGVYDVRSLWRMVEGEDDECGWEQVRAWRRMSDLVDEQRRRFVAAREALERRWPSDSSEASRVFVERLQGLVDSMGQAVAAAESTATGLNGIMETLAETRRRIAPLYEAYQAKANDLTPQFIDNAEDELNAQARQIMAESEQVVAQWGTLITPPPEYALGAERDPGDEVEIGSGSGTSGSDGSGWEIPPMPYDPPPPLPGVSPVLPGTGTSPGGTGTAPTEPPAGPGVGDGPVLGGKPNPAPLPPSGGSGGVAPSVPGAPSPGSGGALPPWTGPTPSVPVTPPGGVVGQSAPRPSPGGSIPRAPGLGRGTGPGGRGPIVNPPGGVIGAPGVPGRGGVGGAGSGVPCGPVVNPPGGVIGQPGGAAGRGGVGSGVSRGSAVSPHGGAIGQPSTAVRGTIGGAASGASRGSVTNPPVGVTGQSGIRGGAVRPAAGQAGRRRHDPGPGIIGLDR